MKMMLNMEENGFETKIGGVDIYAHLVRFMVTVQSVPVPPTSLETKTLRKAATKSKNSSRTSTSYTTSRFPQDLQQYFVQIRP